jgi:hypothetical protein
MDIALSLTWQESRTAIATEKSEYGRDRAANFYYIISH